MLIPAGSTDRTMLVFARDTATGIGKTGLVAASINAMYTRVETDNDVTIAAITEVNLTALTDAHSDGGWYPVDATNAPGLYRFDLPDAVCATGAWEAVITIIDAGSNNFEIAPTRIELKNDYASTDVLTTALTESYATDGATATLTQLMYMIWSFLAEKNISGTTLTAKKLDGSTTSMTFTLDSATVPTTITRAT